MPISKEQLEELRDLILTELVTKIKSGKARSYDIATAVKFIKDNGDVQRALDRPSGVPTEEELDEMLEGEDLPFGDDEDSKGEDNPLEGVNMDF